MCDGLVERMTSLQDQIDAAYQKKVVQPLEKTVRKTALMAFANIGLATPVDTGRARANWNIAVGTVDGTTTDNTTPPDFIGKATAAIAGYVLGKVIYLSNNLPYIKRLNDGSSKQAPKNFVKIGVELAKRQAKAGD